jgi:hypothetical protein
MSVLPSGDMSAPEPEPMGEQRIERLVSEISQVIRWKYAENSGRWPPICWTRNPPLNLQ